MTDPGRLLVEQDDRWLVGRGGEVIRLILDYAVTFVVSTQAGILEVRIGGPFVLLEPSRRERLLVPEGDPAQLGPVLALTRVNVERIEAYKDGHLEVLFDNGWSLSVPAEEGLEPWDVSGPEGILVVSLPGGDLATWPENHP